MNDQSDKQLDQLLQRWSFSHAASTDELAHLQRRVSERVSRCDEIPIAVQSEQLGAKQILIVVASLAAVLLVAFSLRQLITGDEDQVAISNAARFVSMSDTDIAAKGKLLAEMQLLFDKRLAWFVEQADEVRMDVQSDQDTAATPFLACRLALVSRRADDADWQLAWSMDVLSRDQQVLDIPTLPNMKDELSMWVFVLPDGRIAVDLDTSNVVAGKLSSNGSTILDPGVPGAVLTANRNGVDYQIYQTVMVVDEKTI